MVRPSFPVYYGSSMRGIFTPGERLELETVDWKDLSVGDIIAVFDPHKDFYVHRIIDIKNSAAVTMGDNNAVPDELLITSESEFYLVKAAVDPTGVRRRIIGGCRGMLIFCYHQYLRRFRQFGAAVLCRLEKFFFWRREVDAERIFGDEICYYFHGKPVARRNSAGKIVYASWRKRLFFKVTCGVKHAVQD